MAGAGHQLGREARPGPQLYDWTSSGSVTLIGIAQRLGVIASLSAIFPNVRSVQSAG